MTETQIALLVAGAALGGFVNGLAGFGTALFALGFWLQFLEPIRAVSLVVVLSVVTGLQGVWLVRKEIGENSRRLIRFLVPGILGIPLGVVSLKNIDAETLKLVIAGLMLLYGGYFTVRRNLPKFERPTPFGDGAVGFLGGILGGAAGLSGALATMWCALRPWSKAETRAVLQPYNVAILGVTGSVLIFSGAYDRRSLLMVAIALPVAAVASRVGIFAFGQLTDNQFRRVLIGMTFLSGVILTYRTLF